jgi:arylsulfatase A-like enzyme
MRVVFVVLDALPPRHVGPQVTPHLWRLSGDGERFATGHAVMTSATYPNHATFVTGSEPIDHRLLSNYLWLDGALRAASDLGPAIPTVFDACERAGRSSACVVGDQHLIGVMGGRRAHMHWPVDGVVPDGAHLDAHGYLVDDEVVPWLLRAAEQAPDLLVGHLNAPDTAAHVFGPDSGEALEVYRATDAALSVLLDALRPAWDDTVVVAVSDHDQESMVGEPIDLYPVAPDGLIVIPEGSGATVWGDDATAGAWLDGVDGVAGHNEVWPGARVVWGDPGRVFALPAFFDAKPEPGNHGGMHTRAQVAVVGGGHAVVPALGRAITSRAPEAADWAPTLAGLLGVALPSATGRALV